jgi:hypothetical protein
MASDGNSTPYDHHIIIIFKVLLVFSKEELPSAFLVFVASLKA